MTEYELTRATKLAQYIKTSLEECIQILRDRADEESFRLILGGTTNDKVLEM